MVSQHTIQLLERDGLSSAQKLMDHAVDMSQTANKVYAQNNAHHSKGNDDDDDDNPVSKIMKKYSAATDDNHIVNSSEGVIANNGDVRTSTQQQQQQHHEATAKEASKAAHLNAASNDASPIEKEDPIIMNNNTSTSPASTSTIMTENVNAASINSTVPSSRIGRAFQFTKLGMGLAYGTAVEVLKRTTRPTAETTATDNSSVVSYPAAASDANAELLASSLCRMRGAALKLGQMLSIQDETLLPPTIAKALQSVREGADAMPMHQLHAQLGAELGAGWRDKLLAFEEMPIAAASIGQVHDAILADGGRRVAIKVQYPGVGNSIESDLSNLQMLMRLSGLAPKGLFLENVIRVGREELLVECDYVREKEHHLRFKALIESDEVLSREKFVIPDVIGDLCSQQVLTTEFAEGGTIDKVENLSQEERNRIGKNILRLTMRELFEWRFMQTDPNWGNFLYDVGTGTTTLIDFGAAREFDKSFVDGYLRIVWANANRDEGLLLNQSRKMGFLTGEENQLMVDAHVQSGFTLGEPFASHEPYDFRGSNISSRMSENGSVFMQHRLTPPPEEVYTLHRKLAGAYMLCIKLNAIISCRDLLEEVYDNYAFDDDKI